MTNPDQKKKTEGPVSEVRIILFAPHLPRGILSRLSLSLSPLYSFCWSKQAEIPLSLFLSLLSRVSFSAKQSSSVFYCLISSIWVKTRLCSNANPQSPSANPTHNKPNPANPVTTSHIHPPTCHHCTTQPKINPPLATTTTKQPPNHKTQPSNNQSQSNYQNPAITNHQLQNNHQNPSITNHQITNHKTKTQPPNHKNNHHHKHKIKTSQNFTHHQIRHTTKLWPTT